MAHDHLSHLVITYSTFSWIQIKLGLVYLVDSNLKLANANPGFFTIDHVSRLNFEYNPYEFEILLIKSYFRCRFRTVLSKNGVTYFLCRPHTAYTTGSSFNNAIEALIGDHDIAVVELQTIFYGLKCSSMSIRLMSVRITTTVKASAT